MRIRIDLESNPSGTHQQRGVSVQRGHTHFYEKANVRALRQLYHHKDLVLVKELKDLVMVKLTQCANVCLLVKVSVSSLN